MSSSAEETGAAATAAITSSASLTTGTMSAADTADDDLPVSTSDLKQQVKIRMGKDGHAAIPAKTVMQCWDEIVTKHGNDPALFQKRLQEGVSVADTPWSSWTWKEYRGQVDAFGKALLSQGFQRFDCVNVLGFNAPEWFFAHFGAIAAGGVAAGIYSTNGPDACKYISDHSAAAVVVCDGFKQAEKYYEISQSLSNLKCLVMYGPDAAKLRPNLKYKCSVPIYSFEDFLALGKDVSDEDLRKRSEAWKPGETCEIIYTSGTTGQPKGVMITNDNVVWTGATLIDYSRKGNFGNGDVVLSYLPLSHIAAQVLDMIIPLLTGARVYFAQPDALKGSLGATLKDVRPTFFFGVPRVWEKIYDKLQEVGKSTTGVKKILSTWAKSEAAAYWASYDYDALKSFSLTRTVPVTYYVAKQLLAVIHAALGLDRCTDMFVGAAPCEVKILKYFASLDMPIMEVYGMSECTGPHCVNLLEAFKFGTCGRSMGGVETKLAEDTGELCYRGRHVFAGYLNQPDKTKDVIDDDGWLHSGDIATIDGDVNDALPGSSGFITITGRIKELIITAGGENIPPVLIESELKKAMPAVANAMVIGDKRKFLSVLLSLAVEVDDDGVPSNKLTGVALDTSRELGSDAVTTDEARNDPKWQSYFDDGIQKANECATSKAQKVGKWSLLSTDFSEKGGELTPTLKLKRNVAADKHSTVIEAMYEK